MRTPRGIIPGSWGTFFSLAHDVGCSYYHLVNTNGIRWRWADPQIRLIVPEGETYGLEHIYLNPRVSRAIVESTTAPKCPPGYLLYDYKRALSIVREWLNRHPEIVREHQIGLDASS